MFYTSKYLSVIIPAYNEASSIGQTLARTRRFLEAQDYDWEVIVAADGNDGTREAVIEFAQGDSRFIVIGQSERSGKGRGVREGVLRASGSVIGFLDADYKTPIEDVDKLLPYLDDGYDVAIGSRRVDGASIQIAQPIYRRVGSRVFNWLMQRFMGLPAVRDTQCGFKFFNRRAARTLFSMQRVNGYMFDVEVLRLCQMLNFGVKEVGVQWRDDGDSRYSPVSGTIRNAKELLKIRRYRYDLPATVSAPAAITQQPTRLAA